MYLAASTPGLATLAICRYRGARAEEFAEKLGFAVQLTNILRDTAEDLALGRVYLPAEDLERFRCRREDLGGSKYTPDFIELMKFEAARARDYFAGALALADGGAKKGLLPALALGALYEALLDRIEAGGFRVKEGKVRLSAARKARALLGAWRNYAGLRPRKR